MNPPTAPSRKVEREDTMTLPRCPVTGEIKPHRNPQGVSTYKVKVLTIAAVAKIN
jgi:hypothetical protein